MNAPYTLDDLCRFIDAVMPTFQAEYEEAEDNERRWLGNNYSPEDEQSIRSQGRQPISIPVVKTKLTNISGEQQKRRTSFKIEAAVDPNDEIKAELAGLQVKAVERRSNFKFLESEIFDSGMGIKFGVSKMDTVMDNYFKRVVVKKIHYKDFIWDRNSTAYDINEDALWCAEVEKIPRKMLEEIEGVDTSNISAGSQGNFQGRETMNYYVQGSGRGNDYDILSLYHFYIKQPRDCWYLVFPDSQNVYGDGVIVDKFDSKKEADRKLREYQTEYILKGLPPEEGAEVQKKKELRLDYYKFCYNTLVSYKKTEYESFPYNLFRAVHFEDKYASLMDFLKDPQRMIDRMWMQVDYSIGKSLKNIFLMVKDLIDEPIEVARRKLEKTGGVVYVKDLQRKAIDEVTSQGANPQWFQIIETMIGYLEDLSGGKNFQGLDAGSNQSGRSVIAQAQEGQKLAIPMLNNLARWKESVGRNILWWLEHYETAEDVIKVQGGALTPEMIKLLQENNIYSPSQFSKDGSGYVRINQEENELSYLKNSSFELFVTEAELSETDKQMRLANYNQALQNDPMLQQSPTFMRIRLEAMNLKQSEIQMIEQERQQAIEQAKQQAEQAQKLEQDRLNVERAKVAQDDVHFQQNLNKPKEKANA